MSATSQESLTPHITESPQRVIERDNNSENQPTDAEAAPVTDSYIFAYGSLICPLSRAVSAPTLAPRHATPVRVHHLERQFSMPVGGWTAMGVRFRHNASCVGVIIPVTRQELKQLDRRELGYDRNLLEPKHVEILSENAEANHDSNQLKEAPQIIWVYIQQKCIPPSMNDPIAQSYVDIILRGCLSVSNSFAEEFILTTNGWHLLEQERNDKHQKEQGERNADGSLVHWVDDRHDPLYVRADAEYSRDFGALLDQLLRAHVPLALGRRRPHYGRSMTI